MSRINHVWLATYEFRYLNRSVVRSTVALTRSQNAERLIQPLSDNPEILTGDDSLLVRQVSLLSLDKVPLGRGNIDSVVEHLEGLASERDEHDSDDAGGSDADSAAIDTDGGVLMLDEAWHMVTGVHNARSVSPVPAESIETPSESVDEAPSSPLYMGIDLNRYREPIYMDLGALNDSPFRDIGLPSERDITPPVNTTQRVDDLAWTPPVSSSPTRSSRERVDRALDAMSEAIESLREYLSERDDQRDA